jgi:hypothetical protein
MFAGDWEAAQRREDAAPGAEGDEHEVFGDFEDVETGDDSVHASRMLHLHPLQWLLVGWQQCKCVGPRSSADAPGTWPGCPVPCCGVLTATTDCVASRATSFCTATHSARFTATRGALRGRRRGDGGGGQGHKERRR